MTGQQQFTEAQRLAWAIGAYDIQVDIPTDDDASNDAEMFRQWAEQDHGAAARRFIATHDALQDVRFGPETSPYPFVASSTPGFVACIDPRCDHDASQCVLCSPAVEAVEIDPDVPDAAEHFARQVHAITVEHDDDHELRDRMIVNLAVAYAGQFLPGCLAFPTRSPARAATAGLSFRDEGAAFGGGFYVAVMDEGVPGFTYADDRRYGLLCEAQKAAKQWNRDHGVTADDILRVTERVQT